MFFARLCKTLVSAVLDFGIYIASLGYRGAMLLLEGMQRRATKMRDQPYDEHLKELKLSALV